MPDPREYVGMPELRGEIWETAATGLTKAITGLRFDRFERLPSAGSGRTRQDFQQAQRLRDARADRVGKGAGRSPERSQRRNRSLGTAPPAFAKASAFAKALADEMADKPQG